MRTKLIFILCAVCHTCAGYYISSCNVQGELEMKETVPLTLTCSGITDDYMLWDFTPPGGDRIQIASCIWSNSNCQTTDVDYGVTRTQYGSSVLTVKRNHRTKIAGSVRCGGTNGTVTYSPPCNVRVVYPAKQVNNCHAEVDTTDWTVSGSCDVNKIYASDGQYTCLWFHVPAVGQQTSLPRVSFILLINFTDNGLEYQRRRCSFTGQIMPTTDGVHGYTQRIDPGDSGGGGNLFSGQSIDIQHPSDPVLFNCPASVIEGDDVNCSCQTSGSPPAVVTWTSGGRTDNSVLLLKNVSRSLDGHNYTCNQYWGGFSNNWKTRTYPVQVYYPPELPQIAGVKDGGHPEGEPLTLVCGVSGGQPPVRSVTFWCGQFVGDSPDTTATVNGVTILTSHVTFDRLDSTMNGTVCQCSANWSERPSLYNQNSTATITVIGKLPSVTTTKTGTAPPSSTTPTSSDNINDKITDDMNERQVEADNVAGIAGGAAGGIVLVVIVVVVIVIIIKRRKGTPKSANKEDSKEEDFNMKCESSDNIKPAQPKPSAVALRTPAKQTASSTPNTTYYNTEKETGFGSTSLLPTAPQPDALYGHSHNHDLDADMYSSADNVEESPTLATSPGSQPRAVNEYSFVSKPKVPKKPRPEVAEYAVVDKTKSKQTGRTPQPKNDEDVVSPDVYAQVNKSTKPEAEGKTYAQVQKPKPAAKLVPATKPKPATTAKPAIRPKPGQQDTTHGVPPSRKGRPPVVAGYKNVESSNAMNQPTEAGDEYNTLNFRENATAEPPCDPESQYSHIGAV